METGGFSTNPVAEGRRNAGSHLLAIDAHYYNITDVESWPVAGLLVLLDGRQQPVRAELHLYDDLPSHIQEGAVRQSRLVLQERYAGDEPLPLRLLLTEQLREAMDVRLQQAHVADDAAARPRWQSLAIPVIGILLALLVSWVIYSYIGPGAQQRASTTGADSAGAAVELASTGEVDTDGAQVANVDSVDAGEAVQIDSDLAQSVHARKDIGIGMRVQIVPELRLTLRSEPGGEAGVELGYMANSEEATVLAGPSFSQGLSDVIVWWYVQLDDGTEAWAAGNTSELTLLIPVE